MVRYSTWVHKRHNATATLFWTLTAFRRCVSLFSRCGASKWQRCREVFLLILRFWTQSVSLHRSCSHQPCGLGATQTLRSRECRLFNNNSLKNKTRLQRLSRRRFNNILLIFARLCSLMFVLSTAANTKPANLRASILSETPQRCYGYNCVAMVTTLPFMAGSGVSLVPYTRNDNLRNSLPHLNAVVTPETCSVYTHTNTPLFYQLYHQSNHPPLFF